MPSGWSRPLHLRCRRILFYSIITWKKIGVYKCNFAGRGWLKKIFRTGLFLQRPDLHKLAVVVLSHSWNHINFLAPKIWYTQGVFPLHHPPQQPRTGSWAIGERTMWRLKRLLTTLNDSRTAAKVSSAAAIRKGCYRLQPQTVTTTLFDG